MIELRHRTPPAWVEIVEQNLVAFLQDHAANERRVSQAALALAVQHPERRELVAAMVEVAVEELEHFRLVYRLLDARDATLSREARDPYMKRLRAAIAAPDKDEALLGALVLSAIVEARGFERFALLADGLADPALRRLYADLARAEARHQGLYLRLARRSFEDAEVDARLDALLTLEAEVLRSLPLRPALH